MNRSEKIYHFLADLETEIDVNNFVDCEDVECYDDIYDQLEYNNGFDIEIIYYSEAMKYLSENDNSLTESLELATDMGYNVKNINSETLASILASSLSRDNFARDCKKDIDNFFADLEDAEIEE